MKPTPIYYAIFYDIAKPRTETHAMHKRIERSVYYSLIDDIVTKQVALKNSQDQVANFKIISTSTFYIENSIDSNSFVVCDCEKIIV